MPNVNRMTVDGVTYDIDGGKSSLLIFANDLKHIFDFNIPSSEKGTALTLHFIYIMDKSFSRS